MQRCGKTSRCGGGGGGGGRGEGGGGGAKAFLGFEIRDLGIFWGVRNFFSGGFLLAGTFVRVIKNKSLPTL